MMDSLVARIWSSKVKQLIELAGITITIVLTGQEYDKDGKEESENDGRRMLIRFNLALPDRERETR